MCWHFGIWKAAIAELGCSACPPSPARSSLSIFPASRRDTFIKSPKHQQDVPAQPLMNNVQRGISHSYMTTTDGGVEAHAAAVPVPCDDERWPSCVEQTWRLVHFLFFTYWEQHETGFFPFCVLFKIVFGAYEENLAFQSLLKITFGVKMFYLKWNIESSPNLLLFLSLVKNLLLFPSCL